MLRWLLVVTLGGLAPLVDSTRAEACSCVPPTLSRQVLPADGAAEVPTDASIRVFLRGFPEVARQALANEYRLRDAMGAVVALRTELVRTRLDLHPVDRLAPSAAYVLEQLFAYDDEGTLLTDEERARPGDPARAAWFPVVRFTTAAHPASRRRLRPILGERRLVVLRGGGDCGPATSLLVELQPGNALPTDLVELRVDGQGVVATAPLAGLDGIGAGDTLCALDPITLRPGGSLPFEVTYLDLSGRRLGRARGVARTQTLRPDSRRTEHWSSWRPTVSMPEGSISSPVPGPPSCAHGLEVREPTEVARGWQAGDEEAVFVAAGDARWLFPRSRPPRHRVRAYSWVRGAPRAHELLLDDARAAAAVGTPSGPIAVLQPMGRRPTQPERIGGPGHPPPPDPTPLLRAFGPRMEERWSRPMAEGHAHALAHGAGQVLVAWREPRHAGGSHLTSLRTNDHLAYLSVDERTGAGTPRSTNLMLDRESRPPEVAFVAGRFVLFWRPRSGAPVRFAFVGRDGALETERALPLGDSGDFDVVSVGEQVGVVSADQGVIRFAVLDREGRLRHPPVVLSRGVGTSNVSPRVVGSGTHFVVGWRTFPEAESFFTAVDAQGRAAPPLEIADDARFELVAGADGVWAARAGQGELSVMRLACRTTPFDGPPRSIAPGRASPGSAPVDEDVIPPGDRRTAPVRRPRAP